MFTAVLPVTATSSPVPGVACGSTLSRSSCTSVGGGRVLRRRGGLHEPPGGVVLRVDRGRPTTEATPGVAWMACVTLSSVAWSAPLGSAVTSSSGPLEPGPKPSASRS